MRSRIVTVFLAFFIPTFCVAQEPIPPFPWRFVEPIVLETDKLDYLSDLVHRIDVLKTIERYLKPPKSSRKRVQVQPMVVTATAAAPAP